MKLLIQKYKPQDRDAIRNCIIVQQEFERSLEKDRHPGKQMADRYLRFLLSENKKWGGTLWVGKAGASVIGFINVWFVRKENEVFSRLNNYGYVSDIVVLPPFRRLGYATELLGHAEKFVTEKGYPMMKIHSLAKNNPARKLYQKKGFREYDIGLVKLL